ncbi:MAG: hypothetical protein LBB19_02490 [Puniceicoccales bacterium]|nr:hypothetical protein [Puniceicoccales bacterium]
MKESRQTIPSAKVPLGKKVPNFLYFRNGLEEACRNCGGGSVVGLDGQRTEAVPRAAWGSTWQYALRLANCYRLLVNTSFVVVSFQWIVVLV